MIKYMAMFFGWAFLIYILLVGGLFLMQRNILYVPTHEKPDINVAGIIGLEEISVTTEDGLKLFGWYKAPSIPEKPTLVWFHGNGSNAGWSASKAIPYIKAGYGLLATEYRGYAGNPGSPSEEGLYKDARAFLNWLKAGNTPEQNIILYGESIGSGVAVQMAVEYPQSNTLILESPFTSIIALARAHYPFMPVNLMVKDRYDNLDKIRNVKSPLIVIHGTRDSTVPYHLGVVLFNAGPEPKSMITIDGGDHNDLVNFDIGAKVLSILSE